MAAWKLVLSMRIVWHKTQTLKNKCPGHGGCVFYSPWHCRRFTTHHKPHRGGMAGVSVCREPYRGSLCFDSCKAKEHNMRLGNCSSMLNLLHVGCMFFDPGRHTPTTSRQDTPWSIFVGPRSSPSDPPRGRGCFSPWAMDQTCQQPPSKMSRCV